MKSVLSGFIITGLITFPVVSSIASDETPFLIANRPLAQGNAKIIDQTWRIDPNFAGRGVVEYTFVIQNMTKRNIEEIKYEVASYDSSGKIIASDFGFVQAIPAGKTRTKTSFFSYYGGEKTVKINLIDLDFAN